MGFTSSMSSLGSRLDALAGQDSSTFLVTSDRSVNRLVDVTMGTNANGQAVLRDKAPIFFIDDGYFRIEGGTNYAYNGIATVITGKSSPRTSAAPQLVHRLQPSCDRSMPVGGVGS